MSVDISGKKDIQEIINTFEIKKWIKNIPFSQTLNYEDYNRKNYFTPVAEFVLDNDLHESGKNKGAKKRISLIKSIPLINCQRFNKKAEWIYLFVINQRIVKIGGTRTGLNLRIKSYLCGHHIKERGKSGGCSITNGYIYNTFYFYLTLGCNIKMYAYELPKQEITVDIFGENKKINIQTYHAYESSFINDFKKEYSFYPFLSVKSDPDYK